MSAVLPLPTSIVLSLLVKPTRFDWADVRAQLRSLLTLLTCCLSQFNQIHRIDADDSMQHEPHKTTDYTPAQNAYMRRASIVSGAFALFLFLAVWVRRPQFRLDASPMLGMRRYSGRSRSTASTTSSPPSSSRAGSRWGRSGRGLHSASQVRFSPFFRHFARR